MGSTVISKVLTPLVGFLEGARGFEVEEVQETPVDGAV